MKRSLLPLFAVLLAVCGSLQAADDDTAHGASAVITLGAGEQITLAGVNYLQLQNLASFELNV